MKTNLRHFAFCLSVGCISLLATGCMSVTLESPALAPPVSKAGGTNRRFRVEKVDGKVSEWKITADEMNAALRLARPDLYGEDDSIPLAIRIGENQGMALSTPNPLTALLFWSSSSTEWECSAKIYREDGKTGPAESVPCKTVSRVSIFPWALFVTDGANRVVIGKHPGKSWGREKANEGLRRIIGATVGKAIDSLKEEEIGALSKRVPLTLRDMARRRHLEAIDVSTVHFADSGEGDSTTVRHEFKGVEVEGERKHPAVLAQDYDATRRIGEVRIDETGFGDQEAADFTDRLISRICETKAVVIELGSLPPPGARYRVLRDYRDEGNIHVILFEQVQ